MDEKVTYWVGLSDYDLETAVAMQKSGRYLYVGFMCHQCIEKVIKAFHAAHYSSTPPYSHALSYLAQKAGLTELLSEGQKDLMDMLEPLNIEARYPSHKENLMRGLTKERCAEMLDATRQLQLWIKSRL